MGTQATRSKDLPTTLYVNLALVLLGILFVLAHARGAAAPVLLWTLACIAVGALGGFLFGIPKVEQNHPTGASAPGYGQRVNTNLEQISDWLTKIIVGLGLTELRTLPGLITRVATRIAESLGAPDKERSFATALFLYFTVLGFMLGYLLTRMFLSRAFSVADQEAQASLDVLEQLIHAQEKHVQEKQVAAGPGAGPGPAALQLAEGEGTATPEPDFKPELHTATVSAAGDDPSLGLLSRYRTQYRQILDSPGTSREKVLSAAALVDSARHERTIRPSPELVAGQQQFADLRTQLIHASPGGPSQADTARLLDLAWRLTKLLLDS